MEKIIITISPEGHVSVERQGTSNLSGEIMEKVCNVIGEGEMEYAMCVNTCCLCGETYQGFGNNAEPIMDGRCCDACNASKVIPERIKEWKSTSI